MSEAAVTVESPAKPTPAATKPGWEINPIVVKELRQAVRNWTVTTALLLLLLIYFLVTVTFLLGESANNIRSEAMGGQVFTALFSILTAVSLSFLPLYVGVRLAWERTPTNIDLLYITTLTPSRIIRGKMFSGVYLAVLFFSVTMPFMVFTYLLRGVDLPTIFTLLLFLFLGNIAGIQFAILVAALPMNRILKLIVAGFFGMNAVFSIFGIALSAAIGGSGRFTMNVISWNFWAIALSVIAIGLLITGLAYVCAVACVTPLAANRALPVRIYATAMWLLAGVLASAWAWHQNSTDLLVVWMIGTWILLVLTLMISVCSQDHRSLRVRQAIPVNPRRRFLAYLFYNGPDNGIAWSAAIGLLTLFICFGTGWLGGWMGHSLTPATAIVSNSDEERLLTCTTMLLYLLAYALTAVWLHRRFLANLSAKFASVIFLLMPPLLFLIPTLFFFFVNRLSWDVMDERQLGSLFNLFVDKVRNNHLFEHLLFAGGWLLLILLLNARWLIRQIQDFKPYRPEEDESSRYAGSPPPKFG
ncbi:MAG: hypothetical protein EXS29_04200 [Pedosphaera sp.]|nr:hypothetical protein [Pedosphaera sp.]